MKTIPIQKPIIDFITYNTYSNKIFTDDESYCKFKVMDTFAVFL